MRPGDRVARQDIPAIVGMVVSVRNGFAQVRWSEHFSQWIWADRLTKHNNESEAIYEQLRSFQVKSSGSEGTASAAIE
jgi:hypothetical protein